MEKKPEIDLTYLKYQWDIIQHQKQEPFVSLGFDRVSDNLDDPTSWFVSGSAILYVKTVMDKETGVYGLGFSSDVTNEYQALEDPNGMEINVYGHDTMNAYLEESFKSLSNMPRDSELINFYAVVYETTDISKTLQFYLTHWHWNIVEEGDNYVVITSNKGRTMLKFVKGDKNVIKTVYVGVKDIKKQISKIIIKDYNVVDPGKYENNIIKLPTGFTESIINNYKLTVGGKTQNYAVEFCVKDALPNVDFIFSQRFAFNTLSHSNYDKFYNQTSLEQ